MKKRAVLNKYIIANLTLVIIASTISAFDGKREGTIFGIAGGTAPYGNSTVFLPDVYSQGGFGESPVKIRTVAFAINLQLGHGLNEKNAIILNANMIIYQSDPIRDRLVVQGFLGPTWNHYFAQKGNTLFTFVGVGIYHFQLQELEDVKPGLGLLFGFGYEFSPNYQITINYGIGRASQIELNSREKIKVTNKHISILFQAIKF